MNSLAATVDLVTISKISDPDLLHRWEAIVSTLSQGATIVIGMSLVYLLMCFLALIKKR